MSQNPSAMEGGVLEVLPAGMEALERLRRASPPRYLTASPELSQLAREASAHLFSSLIPFCAKPLPVDRLLVEESFDAEQIWHQIEFQTPPMLPALRRDLKRFEKMEPRELLGVKITPEEAEKDFLAEHVEDAAASGEDTGDELAEGEGLNSKRGGNSSDRPMEDNESDFSEDEDEEKDEDEDEDEDELLIEHEYNPPGDGNENEDPDSDIFAKYDDFFGDKDRKSSQTGDKKNKWQSSNKLHQYEEENESRDDDDDDDDDDQADDEGLGDQEEGTLSTFEKQSRKLKAEIEKMEKENLAPKTWTMTGEVAAAKRPKNSALEVDLDFEHNRGRPPVITEENNDIIEDVILKRIREGFFDDVQRAPSSASRAPKAVKELDDSKSKKGLGEIYEEEYAQTTGLTSVPLSSSDELKKEASLLFKKLCLKLDALSHFHFAPKPVIEELSVEANLPALAMEEVAPLAVSDAGLLAPEEIFRGKGDVKEEGEMTQVDRKRKRAKKKRKFKAETAQKAAKKARGSTNVNRLKDQEGS